ncbi:MAG: deoxyuridine 5'-triphosphate nucleotidohydrolase [Lachnospiraceae bacterium]|nr:deoxyuridine 5'-triphosphate nucleotidohydrolase [Lachnospiraceae bacterium]
MKQVIKIKMLDKSIEPPSLMEGGDWIDLRAAEDIEFIGPYTIQSRKNVDRTTVFSDYKMPLGVAMELPDGYEAVLNMRSSAYKNYTVILANGQGVIDGSYKGDNDQWFVHLIPFRSNIIKKGDRICQFRVQLSQRATCWQKIKWLFSNGVKIKVVNNLNNNDRGGHGSTGKI